MSKQTEYSNAFIRKCELLFQDIRENKSLKICIETLREAQQAQQAQQAHHLFEPLWFIYYMYFAIHNPKLEEYINMKHAATADEAAAANILKNMIRRRANTSTLVFKLYIYANIQKGAVTYIYPANTRASASTSASVLKSLTSTHLKTAAAVIHKLHTDQRISIESVYNDYVAATAHPRHNTSSEAPAVGGRYPPATVAPSTRLSTIKYSRKDIIFLALVCYMKIDEIDINTKGIFISATKEEIMASPPPSTPPPPPSPYDEKYKYLLT
jgi:hypothetical protein